MEDQDLQRVIQVAFYLSGLREGKDTPLGDAHVEALFRIVPLYKAYVKALENGTKLEDELEF